MLGAFLFLVQRGIAAGITIYAPAIILSAILGWQLNLTIWLAGGFVIIYTVVGGTTIVSLTQRYQMMVILAGMAIAFGVVIYRLVRAFHSVMRSRSPASSTNCRRSISRSIRTNATLSGRERSADSFSLFPISAPINRRCSVTSRAILCVRAGWDCSLMPSSKCRCSFSFFCSARWFLSFINSKSLRFFLIARPTNARSSTAPVRN